MPFSAYGALFSFFPNTVGAASPVCLTKQSRLVFIFHESQQVIDRSANQAASYVTPPAARDCRLNDQVFLFFFVTHVTVPLLLHGRLIRLLATVKYQPVFFPKRCRKHASARK